MFAKVLILAVVSYFNVAKSKIVPKIVGGEETLISHYPHSVYIATIKDKNSYVCGASILNQRILLTAAHCIEESFVTTYAYTHHNDKTKGTKHQVAAVKRHEKYRDESVSDDIGIVMVKRPIKLNAYAQRVSIDKSRPQHYKAAIAGWGLISEEPLQSSNILQHAELEVWTYEQCRRQISSLPKGCICAGTTNNVPYPSGGDSGSALIVNNYIQIGIVSYKRPEKTSIVAFTDVAYYFSWIQRNTRILYCNNIDKYS